MAQSTLSSVGSTYNSFAAQNSGLLRPANKSAYPILTYTGAIGNNYNLNISDSAALVRLTAGGGTVRLPSSTGAAGCFYTLSAAAAGDTTNAWTITSATSTVTNAAVNGSIYGTLLGVTGSGYNPLVVSANTGVGFGASCALGDQMTLVSNGTVWVVNGQTTVAAGLAV